jgi:SnoaL-like polyketide cyclase
MATNNISGEAKLAEYEQAEQLAQVHLDKFDDLDFNVFSNQAWVRLHESHAEDVLVHWPDGREVRGLEQHIRDLSAMFVYAPDTRIKVHPVKIAQGAWTSVIGVMEGTFTKRMPTADGGTVSPTGKSFKIPMCTVGHWKDGVMDEEYLFWDNQTYMRQLGIS